jgi:hypothetical protein
VGVVVVGVVVGSSTICVATIDTGTTDIRVGGGGVVVVVWSSTICVATIDTGTTIDIRGGVVVVKVIILVVVVGVGG